MCSFNALSSAEKKLTAKSNTKNTASRLMERAEAANTASPSGPPPTSRARAGAPNAANTPQGHANARTADRPRHSQVARPSALESPRPTACAAAAPTAWAPPQANENKSG